MWEFGLIESRESSSSLIVHQYLPGMLMASPVDKNEIKYLTFPYLLFDMNSPIVTSEIICADLSNKSVELSFSPGDVHKYKFQCRILNPDRLLNIFLYNIELFLDWKMQEDSKCVFPTVDPESSSKISGVSIKISVTPLGFADIFYSVDKCNVHFIMSESDMKINDTFTQLIILDGGPKFLTGSVYLFIGMGAFCVIVSIFLIGVLKSIYYSPSKAEQLTLEYTTMSLELVSDLDFEEEERQKNFISKIDDLLY